MAKPGILPDELTHPVDGSARAATKGVASCEKPRVGACSRGSADARMGKPTYAVRRRYTPALPV